MNDTQVAPKGHVFVINSDLTRLACDAWLLPTDNKFDIEKAWAHSLHRQPGRWHGRNWGGQRVQVVDPSAQPRIYLGDIGRSDQDAEWYADGVEDFVRRIVKDGVEPRGRCLRVAINLVGTGRGGMRHDKGAILEALFGRLHALAETYRVDIVVVCWGDKSYAAAQRARLKALTRGRSDIAALAVAASTWRFDHDDKQLHTAARRIADQARKGKLSLFIGAGASIGADLPTWSELLRLLSRDLGVQDDQFIGSLEDPRDQASLLERRFRAADRSLNDAVVARLVVKRYALLHGLLASLPCTEVITTNFDELFELAANTAGRMTSVLPGKPIAGADRWLLKLHGSVGDPSSLVFTRSAYVDAPRQRGALFGLVQAMLLTRHMLFVGYSLKDEDFHEIIHDVRKALSVDVRASTLGTAITLFEDPVRSELWKDDVDVIAVRPHQPNPDRIALADAGRDVERFCDLVAFLAADRSAFVLDDSYASMRTASEQQLASQLLPIVASAEELRNEDGWEHLFNTVHRLGWRSRDEGQR